MRVLIVLLSANFFGTERHAVELANGLAEGNHEVALLLRAPPRDPGREAGYATLRRAISERVRVFTASRAFPLPALARAVLRFRPAIIHTHYERSARWATRLKLGVPVVATNHAGWAPDYARCDGLICLTRAQLAAVPGGFAGRVLCIGNWVLPRPPPTPAQIAAARESLGVAAADFVIGSVARLDPEKGHGGLIEAFLRAGLPGAKLVIIGSGGLRAVLRAQAQEAGGQVILADFRPDVRDLYPAFDLFVLNSTVEQLPLALLEALDAGVPAIATATDGAREIAAHLPLRLVPIGDTAALVQALQEGRAGRLPASPEGAGPYRLDAMLPRIVAAYEQVIVHHTAGRRPGGLLGYSLRA